MKTLTFNISDEAYEFFLEVAQGAKEYRDWYNTKEDFLKSEDHLEHGRSLEWFMNRNEGGTYHLIQELLEFELVESDGESWHSTYIVSHFGLKFLTEYQDMIGHTVGKCDIGRGKFNMKPFKSGSINNTVKGIIVHPIMGIPAFTFEEDDSYVECRRCRSLNTKAL